MAKPKLTLPAADNSTCVHSCGEPKKPVHTDRFKPTHVVRGERVELDEDSFNPFELLMRTNRGVL